MELKLDDETENLARELAALTGEEVETAVIQALRERLARERKKDLAERLMEIGRECAEHLNAPGRKMMEVDDLYDKETGLPK